MKLKEESIRIKAFNEGYIKGMKSALKYMDRVSFDKYLCSIGHGHSYINDLWTELHKYDAGFDDWKTISDFYFGENPRKERKPLKFNDLCVNKLIKNAEGEEFCVLYIGYGVAIIQNNYGRKSLYNTGEVFYEQRR